jgi:hypothetical protein
MYIAEYLANCGNEVHLLEKEEKFMSRASYNNQARVHNGYHYPRSILTALRSRVSFPRFVAEFGECVIEDFEKYYMVSSHLGKISANQFVKFCERIGASCEPAPTRIQKLTNPALIDACFTVTEYAFDALKLRDIMMSRLATSSVKCTTGISVENVKKHNAGLLVSVKNIHSGEHNEVYADHVFNCTYSHLNYILSNSCIKLIPLKHEMTEMCLVDVPDALKKIGLTLMCGPFFSVMPFPSAGLHSFSHVRYTPHYDWMDKTNEPYRDSYLKYTEDKPSSAWRYMQKDAMRYLPLLEECIYNRSLWEVKTVLPRSESNDSRPILLLANHGLSGFHCVLGGKIDNIYDAVDVIAALHILD